MVFWVGHARALRDNDKLAILKCRWKISIESLMSDHVTDNLELIKKIEIVKCCYCQCLLKSTLKSAKKREWFSQINCHMPHVLWSVRSHATKVNWLKTHALHPRSNGELLFLAQLNWCSLMRARLILFNSNIATKSWDGFFVFWMKGTLASKIRLNLHCIHVSMTDRALRVQKAKHVMPKSHY